MTTSSRVFRLLNPKSKGKVKIIDTFDRFRSYRRRNVIWICVFMKDKNKYYCFADVDPEHPHWDTARFDKIEDYEVEGPSENSKFDFGKKKSTRHQI